MVARSVLPGNTSWLKAASMLVLLMVLVALVPGTQPSSLPPRAQPILLALAAQHPDARVNVVVQKQTGATYVEELAARLGGVVTLNLHIINGFAAELPARAIVELARTAGVRWISLDAPVLNTACADCVDTSKATSSWLYSSGLKELWKLNPTLQGQGIGVAVVDSGINPQQDLYTTMGANRIVAAVRYNDGYNQSVYDNYGHGNHVAGIIGSDGDRSGGTYIGVAPAVNLINVKVSDDAGRATTSRVVKGLQWVYENRAKYNIRVVNLSLNSGTLESYHTNPLNAAVEILWFNGVVVVVSAGNNGSGGILPPANDPFVITVGATDDKGTSNLKDDDLASFSAYGKTIDGFDKPDLVASGKNIVSLMANPNSVLAAKYPGNVVYNNYFRMSGTSMAAPIVAGAVALLLQDEPNLTPDQVKYRLMTTAVKDVGRWPQYTEQKAGAGYLDINAAITANTTQSANTGILTSNLLSLSSRGVPFGGTSWNSVNWGSVNWGSVNWGSVNWGSVNWGSDYWGN
jgi:serine protease AprX